MPKVMQKTQIQEGLQRDSWVFSLINFLDF